MQKERNERSDHPGPGADLPGDLASSHQERVQAMLGVSTGRWRPIRATEPRYELSSGNSHKLDQPVTSCFLFDLEYNSETSHYWVK